MREPRSPGDVVEPMLGDNATTGIARLTIGLVAFILIGSSVFWSVG